MITILDLIFEVIFTTHFIAVAATGTIVVHVSVR